MGGAETFVEDLVEELSESGISQKIHYLDMPGDTRSRVRRIMSFRMAIKKFCPEIVVSHTTIPAIYARLAAKPGMLNVTVLHSSGNDFSGPIVRFLERILRRFRTDGTIAVSSIAKLQYEKFLGANGSIEIIPNGRRQIRGGTESPKPNNAISIVTLSRVSEVKNPRLWYAVAEEITAKFSRSTFAWYGPVAVGEDFDSIIGLTQSSESRIRFMGVAESVEKVLSSAHIMFHPSDREAHSLSLIEAAMTGLPIVCSQQVADSIGREYVDEVFPAGNVLAAVDALAAVILDYPSYLSAARGRQNRALEDFSMEKCASKYFSYFDNLLKR